MVLRRRGNRHGDWLCLLFISRKLSMLLDADESQLVLVDFQVRLMPVMLDAPAVLANAVRLARIAALMQVPVFVSEQNPSKLGASVPELGEVLQAARARVLAKMQFSAVEEGLGEWLRPPTKPVQGNARSLLGVPGPVKLSDFLEVAAKALIYMLVHPHVAAHPWQQAW